MDQIIRNKDLSGDQVRSFISIDLEDQQVLSRIASILSSLQALGGDLKPVEGDNIHLTLKFLGNVSKSRLAEVKSSLQQLTFPSFTVDKVRLKQSILSSSGPKYSTLLEVPSQSP